MIRTTLGLAALTAACGGKSPPPPTPVASLDDTRERIASDGGSTYGGADYGGDPYGGDLYGGTTYGGNLGHAPPALLIDGRWVTACTPGATKREFTRHTFDATDADWDLRIDTFTDAACTKRTSQVHTGGGYGVGKLSAFPFAWGTTFDLAARELTAFDKKTAAALGKACGTKLTAGTAQDILELGCPKLGIKPRADCPQAFDLLGISDGTLRFGQRPAEGDLCSEDRRPTTLSTVELSFQWMPIGVADCDVLGELYLKLMACPKLASTGAAKDTLLTAFQQMRRGLKDAIVNGVSATDLGTACVEAKDPVEKALTNASCGP